MTRPLPTVNARDEAGVAALIVALSLVVVFGMTVLVVDLGALIVKHRGLVNANDAAALAAAQSLAKQESEEEAQELAKHFAKENLFDADPDTPDWWAVTSGLPGSDCDSTECGSVRVSYRAQQALFFAPVLGLGDQLTAHGMATAIWGPVGGGEPIPVTIHDYWLNDGHCDAPVPNDGVGTLCRFWLDGRGGGNGDGDEGSGVGFDWAWINFDRWNVESGADCPVVKSSRLREWISDNGPLVRLDSSGTTLVCTTEGSASKFLPELEAQEGELRVFPVDDPDRQIDDKYGIVGFTILKIEDALSGESGAAFLCEPPFVRTFNTNDTWNLKSQSECPLRGLHYPDNPNREYPRIRPQDPNEQAYRGGSDSNCSNVDYCYDSEEHVITWLAEEPAIDALVDWTYRDPPAGGRCGPQEPDPDAVCLVVSWQGYRTGGINPGGGVDFGLRAVRLSA